MKVFVTSLVLLCTSVAFSQGPAQDLILTKRMVIKDSLGQVVSFSDCTDQLKTKEWILHPEKNEQGKIIYYLLKKASDSEREILSDSKVSEITEDAFSELKRGKYILTAQNGDETRIRRKGNKQVERTKTESGDKMKVKYRITWLDDASYILKPWNKVTETSKTPRYKIIEVGEDSHTIRVIQQSSLGATMEVRNK